MSEGKEKESVKKHVYAKDKGWCVKENGGMNQSRQYLKGEEKKTREETELWQMKRN